VEDQRSAYTRTRFVEPSKRAVAGFYKLASQMVNMISSQNALFHELPRFPEGFRYKEELVPPEEELALISTFERLPFREFEYRGFLGKRRTVSFGWRYDFNVRELQETEHIPTFLLPLRRTAAKFANLSEDRLQHALVTE
jgi:hypothetical protein